MFAGKMPRKVYKLERKLPLLKELVLPDALSIYNALQLVLRLPAVASKRYLTNKVDRCVTGLVAQQQCVGPLHTPLADVAVTAISYFGYVSILLIDVLDVFVNIVNCLPIFLMFSSILFTVYRYYISPADIDNIMLMFYVVYRCL